MSFKYFLKLKNKTFYFFPWPLFPSCDGGFLNLLFISLRCGDKQVQILTGPGGPAPHLSALPSTGPWCGLLPYSLTSCQLLDEFTVTHQWKRIKAVHSLPMACHRKLADEWPASIATPAPRHSILGSGVSKSFIPAKSPTKYTVCCQPREWGRIVFKLVIWKQFIHSRYSATQNSSLELA